MGASGVCHSDLSIQNGTLMSGACPLRAGPRRRRRGGRSGGGRGTNLAPGRYVVVSWVAQCGECFFCTRNQGELCEQANTAMATGGMLDGTYRFSLNGVPMAQMAASGTFSQYSVIPTIGAVGPTTCP